MVGDCPRLLRLEIQKRIGISTVTRLAGGLKPGPSESAGAREAVAKAAWGRLRGLERDDKSVSGRGWGEQGKAGAREQRDAGLGSAEGEGRGGLPAQGLVEDERGHGCAGGSPQWGTGSTAWSQSGGPLRVGWWAHPDAPFA
jgi:hypothetical protein